jgi:hypothetical protein
LPEFNLVYILDSSILTAAIISFSIYEPPTPTLAFIVTSPVSGFTLLSDNSIDGTL